MVNKRQRPGNSHFAERGCARSVSRSKLAVSTVHEHPMRLYMAGLLRLVLRTHPRSGPKCELLAKAVAPAPAHLISNWSFVGSFGNVACGSLWYQNATEAMSSCSG